MSHCKEVLSSLSLQSVFSGFLLLDGQVLTTRGLPENKTKSPFNLWSMVWHGHPTGLFCRQQKQHWSHCRQGELEDLFNDGRL